MATQEFYVVAERQKLFLDGADQSLVVTSRQVCSADRATKQDIPDMGEARAPIEVDDMAWSVAGAMQHFENMSADRHGIAIVQKPVWNAVADRIRKAETKGLDFKIGKQRAVSFVRPKKV